MPLGTLEWHSEHLPLSTDGLPGGGLFARVAEVGGIVPPPLQLEPDRRTLADCGTDLMSMDDNATVDPRRRLDGSAYWADDDLFAAILDATARNLARAGFRISGGPRARAIQPGVDRLASLSGSPATASAPTPHGRPGSPNPAGS